MASIVAELKDEVSQKIESLVAQYCLYRVMFTGKGVTIGLGLKRKKRMFSGCGLSLKHEIEFDKLQKGILAVRHDRGKSHAYKIKPTRISEQCRDVLTTLAARDGTCDMDAYRKLHEFERCLVETYAHKMKVDNDELRERRSLKELTEKFEVIRGELSSGNNNPQLHNQLHDVCDMMLQLSLLSKKQYDTVRDHIGW